MANDHQKTSKTRPSAGGSDRFSAQELSEMRSGVARRLKEAFNQATNAEIARRLKSSDATVKAYTEGSRFPLPEMLIQIHNVTGINIHWLMTGKGSMRVDTTAGVSTETERAINTLAGENGLTYDEQIDVLTSAAIEFKQRIG